MRLKYCLSPYLSPNSPTAPFFVGRWSFAFGRLDFPLPQASSPKVAFCFFTSSFSLPKNSYHVSSMRLNFESSPPRSSVRYSSRNFLSLSPTTSRKYFPNVDGLFPSAPPNIEENSFLNRLKRESTSVLARAKKKPPHPRSFSSAQFSQSRISTPNHPGSQKHRKKPRWQFYTPGPPW